MRKVLLLMIAWAAESAINLVWCSHFRLLLFINGEDLIDSAGSWDLLRPVASTKIAECLCSGGKTGDPAQHPLPLLPGAIPAHLYSEPKRLGMEFAPALEQKWCEVVQLTHGRGGQWEGMGQQAGTDCQCWEPGRGQIHGKSDLVASGRERDGVGWRLDMSLHPSMQIPQSCQA